jgi:hypothetical protein
MTAICIVLGFVGVAYLIACWLRLRALDVFDIDLEDK